MADIKSLTREELAGQFAAWSQPAYRVDQLLHWLYVARATSWDAMSNLPKSLRQQLQEHYTLQPLELVRTQGAGDSTQKFLWKLSDGAFIESVLIPANPGLDGEASDRHTLCVSTQVGCAYACKFCASGLEGWKRNLRVEEIVEQPLAAERGHAQPTRAPAGVMPEGMADKRFRVQNEPPPSGLAHPASCDAHPEPGSFRPASRLIQNLVIMGMGEPLANYENLLKALRILNAPWGGGIGARKITLSTSGLAPQIRRLADEPLQLRLAISLHGATDETRNRIMPINRRYPLRELTAACEYYQQKKERMITLEYILLAGVNDDLKETRPLAALAHRLKAKVNLIPYNKVEGLPWERPAQQVQEAFLAALQKRDVTATLRREKGHDIDAACGQLRLRTQRELARSLV